MSMKEIIRDSYGPQTAESYDQMANDLFWAYQETLNAVGTEIVYARRSDADRTRRLRKILDIGMGTGNLSVALLRVHQTSQVFASDANPSHASIELHGFDGSPAMMEKARSKFGEFPGVQANFKVGRLEEVAQAYSEEKFSCIVSSYAVHHLNEAGKSELIRRLFWLLEPGGILVIADKMPSRVLGHQTRGDLQAMCSRFSCLFKENPGKMPYSQLCAEIQRQFDADGDQPSSLESHLEWFKAASFEDVRCPYWNAGTAIVSGVRPLEAIC